MEFITQNQFSILRIIIYI